MSVTGLQLINYLSYLSLSILLMFKNSAFNSLTIQYWSWQKPATRICLSCSQACRTEIVKETDPTPLQLFCLQPICAFIYKVKISIWLTIYNVNRTNQPVKAHIRVQKLQFISYPHTWLFFPFFCCYISISLLNVQHGSPYGMGLQSCMVLEVSGKKAFNI